jgi:alpha-beta hydrolase superfamily lysophospholipase
MTSRYSRYFFKSGLIALGLLLGLSLVIYGLHVRGMVNAWLLPLKPIALFLGGSSIIGFVLAGILEGVAFIRRRSSRRQIVQILVILCIGLNSLAYIAACLPTHHVPAGRWGLGLPRPENFKLPTDEGLSYTTVIVEIDSNQWLELWRIPAPQGWHTQGTVILFPGKGSAKSSQLFGSAQGFHQLGYETVLVDYRGVGGSSGNRTTIGAHEAKDVALALDYVAQQKPGEPIVLYGISMGSVAIMRAIATLGIEPDGIILESPFVTFLNAIRSRLRFFHLPTFPTAEVMIFWGSLHHRFNGFAHNPLDYAKQITCPTLLLQGELDQWTPLSEIEDLYANFPSSKQLVIFSDTGHELLVMANPDLWFQSVDPFLQDQLG